MSPSITYPRGRAIAADTTVNIDSEFGAPVQLLQNVEATDAEVTFNGGVAFTIRASETIVFSVPIMGDITSTVALVALA